MKEPFPYVPFILISIFVVVVVSIVYKRFTAESPVPPPEVVVVASSTEPVVQPPKYTTSILAKDGSLVPVRDFLRDTGVELFDESNKVYLIGEEYGLEGLIFQIFYNTNGGGITISLLQPDLAYARVRAEEMLRSRLGVKDQQLCMLQIRVNTPRSVDEDMSGMELGLSFCTNAKQL